MFQIFVKLNNIMAGNN